MAEAVLAHSTTITAETSSIARLHGDRGEGAMNQPFQMSCPGVTGHLERKQEEQVLFKSHLTLKQQCWRKA